MTEDKVVELVIGGLTLFGSLLAWNVKQERRMGRLEFRMEMIYDGWFKNVFTKAVGKDLGTMNSPMRLNERGLALLAPVIKDLELWYKGKESWSNSKLGETLKVEWMDRLIQDIALPAKEDADVCVGLAFSYLRPPLAQIGTAKASDTDPDIQTKGTP